VPPEELKRYILDVEASAREALAELLASAPPSELAETPHLVRGEPERIIPNFAREQGAEVIVMGSLGRSGVAGLLIGEMAEEILSRVSCGVLCVKPDGFVSPVQLRDASLSPVSEGSWAGGRG
jgi:nucleotide-binding universal stress UspA family protein